MANSRFFPRVAACCVAFFLFVLSHNLARAEAAANSTWSAVVDDACDEDTIPSLINALGFSNDTELRATLARRGLSVEIEIAPQAGSTLRGIVLRLRVVSNASNSASEDLRTIETASCDEAMVYASAILGTWLSLTPEAVLAPASRSTDTLSVPHTDAANAHVAPSIYALPSRAHTRFVFGATIDFGMAPQDNAWPNAGPVLGVEMPLVGNTLFLDLRATFLIPPNRRIAALPTAQLLTAFFGAAVGVGYELPLRFSRYDAWTVRAGLEGGTLYGESRGTNVDGAGFTPSAAVQIGATARWQTHGGWGMDVDLLGQALLLRPEFIVTGIGSVYRSEAWNARVCLTFWTNL